MLYLAIAAKIINVNISLPQFSNNSLSKSQPNSPQLERAMVPLKMGDSAPRPPRTLHSLSLDLSQLRNDDLAQSSSSDLSSTNSEDDLNRYLFIY